MAKKTSDRRRLPHDALRAFEGVARHGSFTAAAPVQLAVSNEWQAAEGRNR